MKTYEFTYILSPEMTSEQAEAKAKELESFVVGSAGTILKHSLPVAKTFSYQIGKTASGFWGVLEFQTESEKLPELEQISSKDQKIIRHMTTVKEFEGKKKERRIKPAAPQSGASLAPEGREPAEKQKVELKDIEQTLDEILG